MKTNYILWEGFWQLADPKVWVASTIPLFFSSTYAYKHQGFIHLDRLILSLLGVYLIEIGKNAINEYVDYKTGVDRYIMERNKTPFSGGKRTIVGGLLTLDQTKTIGIFTITMAVFIGIFISIYYEPRVFLIGLIGVLLSVFYSLPPFMLAYRGLGEVVVGFVYGPLIVSGSYLVQTNTLEVEPIIISVILGLLITNVLIINEFPDYEADLLGNKNNVVVRLGKKRSLKVYESLYILTYIIIFFLALLTGNPSWAIGSLSLPIALSSARIARNHYNDIPKLLEANIKTIIVYILTGVGLTVAVLTL